MDQKTLWQQYQALPAEVQQQMLDFLAFLQAKYGSTPHSQPALGDLAQEPFVGIFGATVGSPRMTVLWTSWKQSWK
ncbi:MAG: DUF2281 domain-containing protein [Candidatus Viridilinea halotolerans]|uniref:DUF2281 domain-containing protein n=1 Tax=Candidatus Viridilinea halotolerans TaxID=2491704 RepID=A0A426U4T1_9CHLR|nr:MAG: DUF2281 domain-containing protein [Candidatus Viridilinea halotolerans]